MGRAEGITDAELAALPNYQDSDVFSPLDKLILDFAVAMTSTPAEVPEALRGLL